MNAIQQISLKLQLGLDPADDIQPDDLRALWRSHARAALAAPRGRRSPPDSGGRKTRLPTAHPPA